LKPLLVSSSLDITKYLLVSDALASCHCSQGLSFVQWMPRSRNIQPSTTINMEFSKFFPLLAKVTSVLRGGTLLNKQLARGALAVARKLRDEAIL